MMMLVQAQLETGQEEKLIAAAAQGDRGAFGELYSRYARMVHGILLARVPPRDAEDLVQDVFMSAMRQLRVWYCTYRSAPWRVRKQCLGALANQPPRTDACAVS